jgi:uncharacterized protein YndB with AHSA1/START domain
MLMLIAIVVVALVALILIYAATRPDTFEISRAIIIAAPPERIFPLLDDLRALNSWNPFVKADPNIKLVYSAPSSGAGASSTFDGNGKVGAGRIQIIESIAASKVVMSLVMDRPMKAQNRVEFRLVPQGSETSVTWAMTGAQPFINKLMCVFVSSDKMVGGIFAKGLADLKTLAEA